MHSMLNQTEWISRMDLWGTQRKPFVFAIDFKAQHAICVACDDDTADVLYDFPTAKRTEKIPESQEGKRLEWQPHPLSFEIYAKAFSQAMERMQRGEIAYINLTAPTPLTCNLSLREIFHRTKARYRMYVPGLFTVFSPEPFVQIEGNTIRSFPMKGTIDANVPDAARRILEDPKEEREHRLAVDLLRDDLQRVATNVQTIRYRYVEHVRTASKDLLEVSSEVAGDIDPDWHSRIGSMLSLLLPGGSILGSPRKQAIEAIECIEEHQRGFYAGICGHYDGQTLDSAVLIRFIAQIDDQLVFHSGGGITSDSVAQREYQELIDKVYIPVV